ncbi:hypothetical protein AAG570_004152 [Ranatra chinensis]|uniref:Zinc finger protein ZPR1 n=1 Tax=Ranatra chinensis TaxID=642074 RepID=A0ABD0Y3M9_9HEMI
MPGTTNKTEGTGRPLFRDLTADDPNPESTEIESLCVNCGDNGVTRLLLTKIPFYKDVIIMSFSCGHCGFANNEIQPGGRIADRGIRIELSVQTRADLNRQVVKSDLTSIRIPHLDFEIPSQSQKGEVTTLEGIICRVITGLEQDQAVRRIEHPEVAKQLDDFIEKLQILKQVEQPFTMIFEDISGNCFVQNPNRPHRDENCTVMNFVRTKEQNHTLGIYEDDPELNSNGVDSASGGVFPSVSKEDFKYEDLQGEVLTFPTNCPNCSSPCQTNMKVTNIPYFKEVVIMATNCDVCGHRTNEVKSGGGVEPLGLFIEVKVNGIEDFSRDILKSETCSVRIPELDTEVGESTLGGRFTTIEGLLQSMKDQLSGNTQAFSDSEDPQSRIKMDEFLKKFDKVLSGEMPVTLELDDPAGNSYVQSLTDGSDDPRLKIRRYERSFQQNEDLGLNDMKTENYEQ